MASKLEKAQYKYESLLRQLGEKAEMVEVIDKAEPTIRKNYRRAKDALADRNLELELLQSEIERLGEKHGRAKEEIQKQIDDLEALIGEKEDIIDVKRSKANPIKSNLAGAAYDLKFVQKGLDEEMRKVEEKKRREEFKRAKEHEGNVKRMKIEVLKRKKALVDMKRQIKEYEGPAKKLEKEVEQLNEQLLELQDQLEEVREGEGVGLVEEMQRQKTAKDKDVERAEQHLMDVLADVGEDLYERRLKHPVLSKYYADLDFVAETIDKLQD